MLIIAALGPILMAVFLHPVWILLLAVGLVFYALTAVRVDVDLDGLTVRSDRLPWPRKNIPLEQIASAEYLEISPWQWGGWGYRWLPGRTAVVLRRGPGIAVEKTNGKKFAVTVDDAPYGAEVLKNLLSHQPPAAAG